MDDDPNPDPDPDPDAPALVSSIPADKAVGVTADTPIVLTFSEPMNTASVETAFYAPSLGDVTLAWDATRTVLTIKPSAPLAYAEGAGNDPTMVPAKTYEVIIGTAATSDAGTNLAAGISVSFSTLKRMGTVAPLDMNLTRHRHASGTLGAAGADLRVGDNLQNESVRALLTFDLSGLPATAKTIEDAYIATRQIDVVGDPYVIDPAVTAYHVVFADFAAGFDVAPLSAAGAFSQANTVVIQHDVTTKVHDDLLARSERANRSQYRLQFDSGVSADNGLDYALYALANFELSVTYLSE